VLATGGSAPENTADGDRVGEHQCHQHEGDDGVAGDVGANVDESKEAGDETGECYGVDWDQTGWMNLDGMRARFPTIAKPQGERKLTLAIQFENGSPPSRAKAKVCHDVEALKLMLLASDRMIRMAVIAFTPAVDWGRASFKTQMKGYPEGSLSAASTSVMGNSIEMRKTKPIAPLIPKLQIIAFGVANPASLISSDMCAALSEPGTDLARMVW